MSKIEKFVCDSCAKEEQWLSAGQFENKQDEIWTQVDTSEKTSLTGTRTVTLHFCSLKCLNKWYEKRAQDQDVWIERKSQDE